MSRQQKKLQKRKERERSVQSKLAERREARRLALKREREEAREKLDHDKLVRQRIQMENLLAMMQEQIPQDTLGKLKNNIEILKKLEEDYALKVAMRAAASEMDPVSGTNSEGDAQVDCDAVREQV